MDLPSITRGRSIDCAVDGTLFLTATTGFIGGTNQGVAIDGIALAKKTSNGGQSWTDVFQSDSGSVSDFHFVDANTGFAAVFRRVVRTTDAGDAWQEVATMFWYC